jgi:hypothetical protein
VTRQACVDCHFFVKEARGLPSGPATFVVTEEERSRARAGNYEWHKDQYAIACDFGVWDEGLHFNAAKKHEIVTAVDRRHFCFFWQHRPGMLLPAAHTLQQRESEAQEARRDRRLTIYGLWIAALALVANVGLQFAARLLSWWPFR